MKIETRNRAELKSYFVKNAIPTQTNFAELIDGMLNQQEDRLVKPQGKPLSIEAAGDEASEKGVLHIYHSFDDQSPTWTLSLNPRSDPKDPSSARPGLNIGDGEGTSRLFIDRGTRNVGIGTINPKSPLDVNGNIQISNADIPMGLMTEVGGTTPLLNLSVNFREPNVDPAYRGAAFRIDTRGGRLFQWLTRKPGSGERENIRMVLTENGNVGIGTTSPKAKLDVVGDWAQFWGRKGTYKVGEVPGDGNWHSILTNLNHHHAYEVIADIAQSGRHGLTHAIATSTYADSSGISMTQASYGGGKIELRWTGSTYDFDLQIRTVLEYNNKFKIKYHITKLW
jgi:hypothetical protein